MNVKFNLNDHVLVKVTSEGIEALRENHDQLNAFLGGRLSDFTPPQVDENGYTRMQLWCVMQEFGPHIRMGNLPPIETEMFFESVPNTPDTTSK